MHFLFFMISTALMEILGLRETVVQMAKVNGVRWNWHVLRRDDGHVFRKALEFEVKGKRKRGRPKTQVEKKSKSVGLEKPIKLLCTDY